MALYALLSLGCRYGWADMTFAGVSLLRWILIAAWIVHLVLIAGLLALLMRWRRTREGGTAHFMAAVIIGLTVASLGGTIWVGAPILTLTLCY